MGIPKRRKLTLTEVPFGSPAGRSAPWRCAPRIRNRGLPFRGTHPAAGHKGHRRGAHINSTVRSDSGQIGQEKFTAREVRGRRSRCPGLCGSDRACEGGTEQPGCRDRPTKPSVHSEPTGLLAPSPCGPGRSMRPAWACLPEIGSPHKPAHAAERGYSSLGLSASRQCSRSSLTLNGFMMTEANPSWFARTIEWSGSYPKPVIRITGTSGFASLAAENTS